MAKQIAKESSVLKPKKWKPKLGQKYWIIVVDTRARTDSYRFSDDVIDTWHMKSGNYFKTLKEASGVLLNINKLFIK